MALQQGEMPYLPEAPAECLWLDHQITIGKPIGSVHSNSPTSYSGRGLARGPNTQSRHIPGCPSRPQSCGLRREIPPILLLSWNSRSTTHPDRRETQSAPPKRSNLRPRYDNPQGWLTQLLITSTAAPRSRWSHAAPRRPCLTSDELQLRVMAVSRSPDEDQQL